MAKHPYLENNQVRERHFLHSSDDGIEHHGGTHDHGEGTRKMMMWEKLKLVAVGVLVAVGLTAQALSQQAPNGGILAVRPPQTAAQPAEKPNEKTAGDRRWVRSLPSGAIIEVIGVSSFPSGPDTWWRPDGTPLHASAL